MSHKFQQTTSASVLAGNWSIADILGAVGQFYGIYGNLLDFEVR